MPWRQERFTFDEEHFMVDLVFYNRLLRSKEALQKLLQEHITDEDGGEDE